MYVGASPQPMARWEARLRHCYSAELQDLGELLSDRLVPEELYDAEVKRVREKEQARQDATQQRAASPQRLATASGGSGSGSGPAAGAGRTACGASSSDATRSLAVLDSASTPQPDHLNDELLAQVAAALTPTGLLTAPAAVEATRPVGALAAPAAPAAPTALAALAAAAAPHAPHAPHAPAAPAAPHKKKLVSKRMA